MTKSELLELKGLDPPGVLSTSSFKEELVGPSFSTELWFFSARSCSMHSPKEIVDDLEQFGEGFSSLHAIRY